MAVELPEGELAADAITADAILYLERRRKIKHENPSAHPPSDRLTVTILS